MAAQRSDLGEIRQGGATSTADFISVTLRERAIDQNGFFIVLFAFALSDFFIPDPDSSFSVEFMFKLNSKL
jgi:hypothetical protein